MHRSHATPSLSNRAATRRRARRQPSGHGLPAAYACQEPPAAAAPQRLLGLSEQALRDAGMLELLAAQLRIEELETALRAAEADAFVDPLTGALNRRGFAHAHARELARAQRSGRRLALAMIDMDDFKRLNDVYGHLHGDRVLRHLVQVLQSALRPTDVLARFGGEEFVLLLPDSGAAEAGKVVERLRRIFSAGAEEGLDHALTFSAGVVEHGLAETLEEAMARADEAAYAAKRAGKNRVVLGDGLRQD